MAHVHGVISRGTNGRVAILCKARRADVRARTYLVILHLCVSSLQGGAGLRPVDSQDLEDNADATRSVTLLHRATWDNIKGDEAGAQQKQFSLSGVWLSQRTRVGEGGRRGGRAGPCRSRPS